VTETELIRRAVEGDTTAWEPLVRLHQEAVYRLGYLMMGDPDEAEDVAQETFIRAYQALARFDLDRPLRPWLLRIASNLARNRRRSAGRYVAALRRMLHTDIRPETTIDEAHTQRWEAGALWQAVRRLDTNDQQVIYLRYFLDLSVEETAEAIGQATGTVKSRLHRAVTRLRGVVERDFPALGEGRKVEAPEKGGPGTGQGLSTKQEE